MKSAPVLADDELIVRAVLAAYMRIQRLELSKIRAGFSDRNINNKGRIP
ncbi:hypothetical protein FM102_12295 [Corynebacterium glutamicum]|nr:hypothetical protein FM102_12295 [Corynebacterium glutamicum]